MTRENEMTALLPDGMAYRVWGGEWFPDALPCPRCRGRMARRDVTTVIDGVRYDARYDCDGCIRMARRKPLSPAAETACGLVTGLMELFWYAVIAAAIGVALFGMSL